MSSQRQTTSITAMRPPKPPSWRDFVASDVNNKQLSTPAIALSNENTTNLSCRVLETKSTTHLHDVNELPRPSITSFSSAAPANKSAKPGRQRPRAKIHRTRSEQGILTDDLPRDSLPPIIKVTSSRFGIDNNPSILRQPTNYYSSDGYPASRDINRRCQSWLASIEACEPLDEVSYSASTPIPSPVATAVADERQTFNNFGTFPIPLHAYGEDVDVEIPDEMFVWRGERRSSSPLSQEETFPPLTDEPSVARKNQRGAKMTKYSLPSTGSHKDAFIPIENQFLPSDKSNQRVTFSNFHENEELDESVKRNNKKNSSKLCCDMCIAFNCYRRKEVQSDT